MNKERSHTAHPPAPSQPDIGAPGRASAPCAPPPADIELMMFYDGELEEPRRSEVAAFIGADMRARSKLAGLGLASALLRERSDAASPADDIADLVMSKIGANGAQPVQVLPQPLPLVSAPRPAANDNGRRILVGLTALVAAAAAVFAVWSRQPSAPSVPATQSPVALQTAPQSPNTAKIAPVAPSSADPQIDAADISPDSDSEHGVEVAAVNFGAHMGSIFYVPSGSIEAKRTTTVVWLADDAGE